MSTFPICSKCQRPMPKWLGAVPPSRVLCQKCFENGLRSFQRRDSQDKQAITLDPIILNLIEAKDGRRKSIAGLAITLSIQQADNQGLFTGPSQLIRNARKALYPQEEYNYTLCQSVRDLLIKQQLWIPVGKQKKGRGHQNQMGLGDKVLALRDQTV